MAISEEGVSVLDQHSMQPLARYPYDNVVTFGGCQEDFMLVITSETDSSNSSKKYHQSGSSQDSSGTTKLLFISIPKRKILSALFAAARPFSLLKEKVLSKQSSSSNLEKKCNPLVVLVDMDSFMLYYLLGH